jgi:hypothetical protein
MSSSSVRSQLLAIREKHGFLDPDVVVEEARDKNHPLHDRVFDRAPADAAHAWYRHRAHELIQSVRINYTTDDRPKDVRAFIAVPRPDTRKPMYEPVEEVMLDDFTRQLVLTQMSREWRTLKARYGDLVEFADMISNDPSLRAAS